MCEREGDECLCDPLKSEHSVLGGLPSVLICPTVIAYTIAFQLMLALYYCFKLIFLDLFRLNGTRLTASDRP